MKAIRLGVLGCANIARGFIRDAREGEGIEIVTVASRSADKARAFAAATGVPRSVGSYEALLADTSIDAVYIPLPNSLHAEWAIKAARAGKHVLCEKPLALNPREAMRMFDAARMARVVLLEAYPFWFQPQTGAMLDIIRRGDIGTIRSVQASFGFTLAGDAAQHNIRMNPALGGGALLDAGCYAISLIHLVMGGAPKRVTAMAASTKSGVDLWTMASLDYGDGRRAQVSCAMDGGLHRHATIVGSLGTISTEYLNHTTAKRTGNAKGFLPSQLRVRRGLAHGSPFEDITTATGSGFAFTAQTFARLVQTKDLTSVAAAAKASIGIAATLEAMARSARRGVAVTCQIPSAIT
jgi:predicted dehydrogenase